LVQTFSGNHYIHQAGRSVYSGILPLFNASLTEGPPTLGVQFTNLSFPQGEIDLFEWDFDGDGIFDSNETDPYHFYTQPGIYSVTLRITVGTETAETTATDLINVGDGSSVGGSVNGIWTADIGEYTITSDIIIDQGNSLIIEPGVNLVINNGSQILVNGLLQAIANERSSITFSSDDSWLGIKFSNTTEANQISGCDLSNATLSAIQIENSTVDVIANRIFANSSTTLGAAIDLTGSSNVNIRQNFIANNTSANLTGGIGSINSSPFIHNNIIVNNSGLLAGSMSLKNSSNADVQNNTIANNSANNEIFLFDSFPILTNNIIISDNNMFMLINSLPTVSYSCISGDYEGPGNIDEDPLFEAPSNGNGSEYDGLTALWYLLENSPCVDAGHPNENYNDLEDPENPGFALWPAMGTLRNDMGAFGGLGFAPAGTDDHLLPAVSDKTLSSFPNPFNPQTTIKLDLRAAELEHPVTLKVYNLKGQLVKTLIKNVIIDDRSEISWNGSDQNGNSVTSGIYLVMLKTSRGIYSQKMMLLK
ncbi:MAG: right-handed parallel beta-helix repeat-containing protein, partial [Candidatus Cloacimonetes bacterium]|nr:right-handed parallel beta-helix repeat-containing protein [Candidatus Cloacimonadota bacterium]